MTSALLASLAQPEPYRFGALSQRIETALEVEEIITELSSETPDTCDTNAGAMTRA